MRLEPRSRWHIRGFSKIFGAIVPRLPCLSSVLAKPRVPKKPAVSRQPPMAVTQPSRSGHQRSGRPGPLPILIESQPSDLPTIKRQGIIWPILVVRFVCGKILSVPDKESPPASKPRTERRLLAKGAIQQLYNRHVMMMGRGLSPRQFVL